MTKERRLEAIIFALSLVPIVLLAAAFLFVKHRWPFGLPDYNRYREFWGGAPSEVFSHWLDMVVLSGSGQLRTARGGSLELNRGDSVVIPHGAGESTVEGDVVAVRCRPPAPALS